MYRVREEQFVSADVGYYIGYGVECIENGLYIADVSTNENKIKYFVDLINDGELQFIHLMDVVEDFLEELQ